MTRHLEYFQQKIAEIVRNKAVKRVDHGSSTSSSQLTVVDSFPSPKGCVIASHWTIHEEIILLGVITDCNLLCGGRSNWPVIWKCFKIAVKKYSDDSLTDKQTAYPQRSMHSIKKRYKRMFVNTPKTTFTPKDSATQGAWFLAYHKLWMSDRFNGKQKLLSRKCILSIAEEVVSKS